jgi:methionyl-tRNA formyltransferase
MQMSKCALLIGDGPTAFSALRSLARSCQVLGVARMTEPLTDDPLIGWADHHGIPVHQLASLADLHRLVEANRPDGVAISSFSRVIPERTLRLSNFVNVHYSPLPRYRGRANVNWALINGETTAAISIHRVDAGLDDGCILYQESLPIGANDTVTSIYERLNAIQERELGRALLRALDGEAGREQDESDATYACARTPDDGQIDWRLTTSRIDRLIRALSPPFPPAFTFLGGRRLQIARAEPRADGPRYDGRIPGRVVGVSRAAGWVDVLTGDGVLRLYEVKDPGGTTVPAANVISSTRMTLGLSRMDLLRRIEALEAKLLALEARGGRGA